METKISSLTKEIIIGDDHPTVLIGEHINPTGKKKLSAALKAGNFGPVRKEALVQVQAGADIIDVNVGMTGVDEVALLTQAVQAVIETAGVPLCIDSNNPKAIQAALDVYQGKPLINSVNGEDRSLKEIFPMAKEYGAAVIGLPMDERGISNDAHQRLEIASKIVEQAEGLGIRSEDIIIDCLATTLGANNRAGLLTIQTIQKGKAELGVNMTLGVSNISFGLPDRNLLNSAFLAIAIAAGVNCPIVDVARVRPIVLAADLVMGRDEYAMRYIKMYKTKPHAQDLT